MNSCFKNTNIYFHDHHWCDYDVIRPFRCNPGSKSFRRKHYVTEPWCCVGCLCRAQTDENVFRFQAHLLELKA